MLADICVEKIGTENCTHLSVCPWDIFSRAMLRGPFRCFVDALRENNLTFHRSLLLIL